MSQIGVGHYFPTDVSKNGIFNTYFHDISYNCCSTAGGHCDNIFNGKLDCSPENDWISGSNDPYFQVSLKRGFIYPISGAIFSCHTDNCLQTFAILGIGKGENKFKEICKYSISSYSEFKKKISSFPCVFNKPLKAIRIENRGLSNSGFVNFALYFFDFYGYLSFGFFTFRQSLHLSILPNILFIILN